MTERNGPDGQKATFSAARKLKSLLSRRQGTPQSPDAPDQSSDAPASELPAPSLARTESYGPPPMPPDPNARHIEMPEATTDDADAAIPEAPQPPPETLSYASEVRARVVACLKIERVFLREALERGEQDLPTLVADAMNEGTYPKIIRGMTFRGSGVKLILLDGHVPAAALDVVARIIPDDDFLGRGGSFECHVGFSKDARDILAADEGFSIESTGLLPQVDKGEPVDAVMLAKLDAHMPSAQTSE